MRPVDNPGMESANFLVPRPADNPGMESSHFLASRPADNPGMESAHFLASRPQLCIFEDVRMTPAVASRMR